MTLQLNKWLVVNINTYSSITVKEEHKPYQRLISATEIQTDPPSLILPWCDDRTHISTEDKTWKAHCNALNSDTTTYIIKCPA